MKKICLLFAMLAFMGCAFAKTQVTKNEYNSYLKSLGISKNAIKQLNKAEKDYQKNTKIITKQTNEYCARYNYTKERCDNLLVVKKYRATVNWETALKKLLNDEQRASYLEYRKENCKVKECIE